jgi:hypothetical protein
MFVTRAWLIWWIWNIPMSFPISMNDSKYFTYCTILSKPIAYSCLLDLGSRFYIFGPPYCYVLSSWERHNCFLFFFMFIISIPLCCPQPYIHTKKIIINHSPNVSLTTYFNIHGMHHNFNQNVVLKSASSS